MPLSRAPGGARPAGQGGRKAGPGAPGQRATAPAESGGASGEPGEARPSGPAGEEAPAGQDPAETAAPAGREGERIAKWLARAGAASRRDAEKMIAEGLVRLNGAPVTHPASFVTAGDVVQLNGRVIDAPGRARLWRYHKPVGLITTHRDEAGRATVFGALPPDMPRVVSVGRLDLNSEGLLLLTNDGALARRLELPANGWIRRYRVRVHGDVDKAALDRLSRGVTIDGVAYAGIEAGLDSVKGSNAWLTVSLREGRNREIRKVMTHLQLSVTRLIRIAYGPFQLGTLERGAIAEVSPKVLREQLGAAP